jgi:hypothetical protein
MTRDLPRLVETARERGWFVDRTASGHLRMRHPNGALVIAGGMPSDPGAVRNAPAGLKRTERRIGGLRSVLLPRGRQISAGFARRSLPNTSSHAVNLRLVKVHACP